MEEEMISKLCNQIETNLKGIVEEQVQQGNIDFLSKLIDIKKDIKQMEHWKEKSMYRENYGNYGNEYGRRYMGYGARGYDAKYRGDEALNSVYSEYGRYMDSMGRYGADENKTKAFHYMVKAMEEFANVIIEQAETPEQKQMIKDTARRIMER